MNLTHEELVRALLAAQPVPEATAPDAFTTEEWANMLGKSLPTTGKLLKKMCRAGTMEGFRDWRETSAGHSQRYPVYRVRAAA